MMVKVAIKFAAVVIGGLIFSWCLWQVIPFAEPTPLRYPTVEEWSKPYGPNFVPPEKDHLPIEYYKQPFNPKSLEDQ